MPNANESTWHWSPFRNGQPGQAGDLANNFRNEGRDPDPGIFARDPIPNTARFLAREFIQNTVDASRDSVFTGIHGHGAVEVVFRFVELTGTDRDRFIGVAGLRELKARSGYLKEGTPVRSARTCLAALDADAPLRLLFAEEYGASGMYGPWDDDLGTSKMSIALLSGNVSDKPDNAGGSFGHGKSVNAMASLIRLNFAYTCFPQGADEDVTRRLLGVSYWPEHKVDGRRFWGFGLLGASMSDGQEEKVVPWTDEPADAVAQDLGFELRRADDRRLCGTSLLIVDPDVDPEDLVRAIQRYWWPAISDNKLRAKVIDYSGVEHHARPKTDPVLRAFETAYRAIKTPSNHSDEKARVRDTARVNSLGVASGVLGMCPAPRLPDDPLAERQASLIAYVRGLGMVVKYRRLDIGPAFIEGVFVASEDERVERLLVKAEPKTHYDWLVNPDGVEPVDVEQIRLLVNNIHDSVRREVKDYSRQITPQQAEQTFTFKDLDRDLAPLIRGSDLDGGPDPRVRDFSIKRLGLQRMPVGTDMLRVQGIVRVERRDDRINQCKVAIRYYLPDDSSRGKPIALDVQAPVGFEAVADEPFTWSGPIDESPLQFKWTTPPYDRDWEGDLDVEVLPSGA
jgi:hypothetical protein